MNDRHKNQGESPLAGQPNGAGSSSSGFTSVYTVNMDPPTNTLASPSATAIDYYQTPQTKDPRFSLTMGSEVYSPTDSAWSSTSTWVTTTKSRSHYYSVETFEFTLPSSSDWDPIDSSQSHGPLHPAFVVAPIVGFAIVVGLLYACLRNRKRRIQAMAAQANAQEMTMQQSRSVHAYHAPLATSTQFSTSRSYSSPLNTPTLPPPVIIGPILTGADSSYLTGIDTSEEAAMVLDEPTANPFTDNHVVDNDDMNEPPPPYRPRSVALPSFAAASQTHLVERSPFDDDADNVSEMSEPMGERDDAMSAVSDLSYQHDAGVGRTNV